MNKARLKRVKADIIVIGGGGAGCVVMNQLSKDGAFSVLGIEAGSNLTKDPAIEAVGLPALLLPATAPVKYYWSGFRQTEPQPMLNGRVGGDWITGMTLGGGTSVNGLYYGRGSNAVYSRWSSVAQSDNWKLDHILSAFRAIENYQGLTIPSSPHGHDRGIKGPVNVLQTPTVSDMTMNVLLPATQAAFPGIPVVTDYNDPSVQNCIDTRTQWLIRGQSPSWPKKRVSSATAFLDDSVMTPKGRGVHGHTLRVLFNCAVVQIVFSKRRPGVAKRVRFIQHGKMIEAYAKRAVVVAAGINSSKILQLSGIGPRDVLHRAQIKPVFINENVGRHLQNHPLMFITLLADPADNGIPDNASYAFTIHNVYLPPVGGNASDARMVQILFEYVPKSAQVKDALLVIGFELLNPKSEGRVEIQSDDPLQIASASDGVYTDSTDFENMKMVIKVYIRDLLAQLALLRPLSLYYRPILIDPINLVASQNYSDKSVEDYVKNNTNLNADARHFVSHCKMAPLNAGGVVDGDTRVHGTQNVFVVDNSICPVMVDINTSASAMMIGWQSSEIIKRIFRQKQTNL